jgi:hypothetical protein
MCCTAVYTEQCGNERRSQGGALYWVESDWLAKLSISTRALRTIVQKWIHLYFSPHLTWVWFIGLSAVEGTRYWRWKIISHRTPTGSNWSIWGKIYINGSWLQWSHVLYAFRTVRMWQRDLFSAGKEMSYFGEPIGPPFNSSLNSGNPVNITTTFI